MNALRIFNAVYARFLTFLVVASLVTLVIPVTLQIFARYTTLIPTYIWTEEVARFVFIWTIMIGATIGVRESAHFDCDLWPEVGPRGEIVGRMLGRIGVLIAAIVFVTAGDQFTRFAWNRHSELGDLPLWLIHLAWPAAGVSWLLFLVEQVADDVQAYRRTPAGLAAASGTTKP